MHYYQFNIGDYTSHTRGLSLMEDLAYRRMLDAYYVAERPFNGCSTTVAREIGMSEYLDEVDYVLGKFFTKNSENQWVNKRVEQEIEKFQKKKNAAKSAGKASAQKRAQRPFNDRSTDVQPTNNHKPITNKEKNKQKKKNEYSDFFEKTWAQYPKREGNNSKADAYKAWQARLRAGVREDELADGVSRYAVYVRAKGIEGTEYVKQAKTFFGPGNDWSAPWQVNNNPPKRNGTAEDIAREYQQAFGKPPPAGKTTDEVRMLLAQRRDKQQQWWNG